MTPEQASAIGKLITEAAALLVEARREAHAAGSTAIVQRLRRAYDEVCRALEELETQHPDWDAR